MNEKDKIVSYLKKTILKNGIAYLNDNAFEVYEGLKIKKNIKTAILCCLLNDVCKFSLKKNIKYDNLFAYIKKNCLLNDETAAYMTTVFMETFSSNYKKEYLSKEENGFDDFCKKVHKVSWDGFHRWYTQMVYVDCIFNANFSFKVVDKEKVKKDNFDLIKKNPYLTVDFFYNKYKEEMIKKIEDDFDYYCFCDDYYPPVCEDYACNCEDVLNTFCKEHGLKLIDFDGAGETSDYKS